MGLRCLGHQGGFWDHDIPAIVEHLSVGPLLIAIWLFLHILSCRESVLQIFMLFSDIVA